MIAFIFIGIPPTACCLLVVIIGGFVDAKYLDKIMSDNIVVCPTVVITTFRSVCARFSTKPSCRVFRLVVLLLLW